MVNAVGMGAPSGKGRGEGGSSLSPNDSKRVTTRCHHCPCPWGSIAMRPGMESPYGSQSDPIPQPQLCVPQWDPRAPAGTEVSPELPRGHPVPPSPHIPQHKGVAALRVGGAPTHPEFRPLRTTAAQPPVLPRGSRWGFEGGEGGEGGGNPWEPPALSQCAGIPSGRGGAVTHNAAPGRAQRSRCAGSGTATSGCGESHASFLLQRGYGLLPPLPPPGSGEGTVPPVPVSMRRSAVRILWEGGVCKVVHPPPIAVEIHSLRSL